MSAFVHPQGICESSNVGDQTKIWAFTHVLPGAKIGINCNICDHVFIENDVVVGNNVTVKCGVQLWDGVRIEDDVFVGPNVTFCNDHFPRSKQRPEAFLQTTICQGSSIGSNATILPGIKVGKYAMVGAGAVVTGDIPDFAIVVGNPAHIIGYAGATSQKLQRENVGNLQSFEKHPTIVAGAYLYKIKSVKDIRGDLQVMEWAKELPFMPRRVFFVRNVPSKKVRGEHGHRECHQFLIPIQGSLSVVIDDGLQKQEVQLDQPDIGLYIPPLTWGIQYQYSEDAILMVLASHDYEADEYIRSYDEFTKLISEKKD